MEGVYKAIQAWWSWHAQASFPGDYLFVLPAGVIGMIVYLVIRELLDSNWKGAQVFPRYDKKKGLLDLNLAGVLAICVLTAAIVGVDARLAMALSGLGPVIFPALARFIQLLFPGLGRAIPDRARGGWGGYYGGYYGGRDRWTDWDWGDSDEKQEGDLP